MPRPLHLTLTFDSRVYFFLQHLQGAHAALGSGCLAPHLHERSKRVDFPVDEVTVSVDEETGKSVFVDRDN